MTIISSLVGCRPGRLNPQLRSRDDDSFYSGTDQDEIDTRNEISQELAKESTTRGGIVASSRVDSKSLETAQSWTDKEAVRRWASLYAPRDNSRQPLPVPNDWLERLGSNSERSWSRIEKLSKGRLLGRFFAASRGVSAK